MRIFNQTGSKREMYLTVSKREMYSRLDLISWFTIMRVDDNTLKMEHGRFSRVWVERDLTLSVVGEIWLNAHWYKVQYDSLHIICMCVCYRYHHRDSVERKNEMMLSLNHNGRNSQLPNSIFMLDSSNHAHNHVKMQSCSQEMPQGYFPKVYLFSKEKVEETSLSCSPPL